MKRIIYIILFIAISNGVLAQQNMNAKKASRILKQADKQMNLLKYAYAIPLYKTYLAQGGKDTSAFKQLGFAYKMVNQYDSALFYYTKASNAGVKSVNIIPELQANIGNFSNAVKGYENLIAENKTLLFDTRLYGFVNINKFYADSLDYKIYYTKVNSPYNDFNPILFKDGIVFESNRVLTKTKRKRTKIETPEFSWDGAGYSRLYYMPNKKDIRLDSLIIPEWKDKKIDFNSLYRGTSNDNRIIDKSMGYIPISFKQDSSIVLFSKQFGARLNIGSITITQDGKTAYYTKNGRSTKQGYLLEVWEAKFKDGKWKPSNRLFFNKYSYSYFHPAVTPDGKRLYYVSDEPNGFGGTDIYYIEKNEDGSWKPTANAGQDINTAGNELFPSFYDGNFYFSSNGHPGLGGLDIFKLGKDARGDLSVINLGYPVNSNKDDISYTIKGSTGFFSSNRYGSDDIFAFDYAPVYITMNGSVAVDSIMAPGKVVYLLQKNDIGRIKIIDSAIVNKNGAYAFKGRPNNDYTIVTYDASGAKYEKQIKSNDFVKINDTYTKQVALINIPLSAKELAAKKAIQENIESQHQVTITKLFAKTVDSLMKLSKEYLELHHPFDQVAIIKKDLPGYYDLIKKIKVMKGRDIVIVSATDCNGTDVYNEGLSQRRAEHIYKTLANISTNNVVVKHVGERELLKACDDVKKSIEEQVVNRYSYVFIIDKK